MEGADDETQPLTPQRGRLTSPSARRGFRTPKWTPKRGQGRGRGRGWDRAPVTHTPRRSPLHRAVGVAASTPSTTSTTSTSGGSIRWTSDSVVSPLSAASPHTLDDVAAVVFDGNGDVPGDNRVFPETTLPPGETPMSARALSVVYATALTVQPPGARRQSTLTLESPGANIVGSGEAPPGLVPVTSVPVFTTAAQWRGTITDTARRHRLALPDLLNNTFSITGRRVFKRAAVVSALSTAVLVLAAMLILTQKGTAVPGDVPLRVVTNNGNATAAQAIGAWNVQAGVVAFVVVNGGCSIADHRLSQDPAFLRRELVRLRWLRAAASITTAVTTGVVAAGEASLSAVVATAVATATILAVCWLKDAVPNRYVDHAVLTATVVAFLAGTLLAATTLAVESRTHHVTERDMGVAVVAFLWLQLTVAFTAALNPSMSPRVAERARRHAVGVVVYTALDVVMGQAFAWTVLVRYT